MPPFTTKTIPKKKLPTGIQDNPLPSSSSRYRMAMGVFLGCLTLLFGANIVLGLVKPPILETQNPITTTFATNLTTHIGDLFSISPVPKKETVYILLTGIGGSGHEGGDLTDTIIIAAINRKRKTISMLSIPRDLYIAVDNKGTRINELYFTGKKQGVGDTLLKQKIEEMTSITIDHSVMVDFNGFKQVVDILGGIEVNVPEDLIDREFPDNNWGYKVLTIRKGLQTFNGTMALNYARSRHSTSDFSRSARQQLIIKAMKEKVLSSGIYSPSQILELFEAVNKNIVTDLSISEMFSIAMDVKDIPGESISVMNLNNNCHSIKICDAGAFLYNPSRDLFGGASVLIPENAKLNRLSYYDDIRRFSYLFFHYPNLRNEGTTQISVIANAKNKSQANTMALAMKKLGFSLSQKDPIYYTTGAIETSHINYYWNKEYNLGFSPDSEIVEALKFIFPDLVFNQVNHNEYITNDGPRIEIVIGSDIKNYNTLSELPYYIPPPAIMKSITSSGKEAKAEITTIRMEENTGGYTPVKRSTPASSGGIEPGEWENFTESTN